MKGFFDDLFDFNCDGELDSMEMAMEFMAIEELMRDDEEEDDEDDF